MPKKLPLRWRGVFLRALGKSGNVRASAFAAGVDPGTAYDHRAKDAAFAAKWATALEKFKARPSPQPSPARGRGGKQELIPRRTKAGEVQMVRAAERRWDMEKEAAFLAGLRETGCVTSAADAIGMSTTALYARRAKYLEFAERWAAMIEESKARLPELLNAASLASLDPGVPRRGRRLPKVNVDQAIRISKMNAGPAKGWPGGPGRRIPAREPTEEETDAAILAKLAAVRRRMVREGWSEAEEGTLVPPGWVKRTE